MKTRSLNSVVHESRLGQVVQRERGVMDQKIEQALAAFYQYLLENGHLRPTEKLDAEVRAMVDAGEIKPQLSIVSR